MKKAVVCAVMFCAMGLMAQKGPQVSTEQVFRSGGTIRMHLEAGGYTIRPTDSANIVVTCFADSEEKVHRVQTKIKAGASSAEIYVRNTPHNDFKVVIDVPRESNLWVRLSAGQLDVGAVEGDKDLEIRAGQLNVNIVHPEQYGHRDASVLTGEIDAQAFSISKGGLFRSFQQEGAGRYRLHASVMAGQIDLNGKTEKSDQPPGS